MTELPPSIELHLAELHQLFQSAASWPGKLHASFVEHAQPAFRDLTALIKRPVGDVRRAPRRGNIRLRRPDRKLEFMYTREDSTEENQGRQYYFNASRHQEPTTLDLPRLTVDARWRRFTALPDAFVVDLADGSHLLVQDLAITHSTISDEHLNFFCTTEMGAHFATLWTRTVLCFLSMEHVGMMRNPLMQCTLSMDKGLLGLLSFDTFAELPCNQTRKLHLFCASLMLSNMPSMLHWVFASDFCLQVADQKTETLIQRAQWRCTARIVVTNVEKKRPNQDDRSSAAWELAKELCVAFLQPWVVQLRHQEELHGRHKWTNILHDMICTMPHLMQWPEEHPLKNSSDAVSMAALNACAETVAVVLDCIACAESVIVEEEENVAIFCKMHNEQPVPVVFVSARHAVLCTGNFERSVNTSPLPSTLYVLLPSARSNMEVVRLCVLSTLLRVIEEMHGEEARQADALPDPAPVERADDADARLAADRMAQELISAEEADQAKKTTRAARSARKNRCKAAKSEAAKTTRGCTHIAREGVDERLGALLEEQSCAEHLTSLFAVKETLRRSPDGVLECAERLLSEATIELVGANWTDTSCDARRLLGHDRLVVLLHVFFGTARAQPAHAKNDPRMRLLRTHVRDLRVDDAGRATIVGAPFSDC